jgi:hypothetical protein
MSRSGDRVSVPTNGHHPPTAAAIGTSAPAAPVDPEVPAVGVDPGPSRPDIRISVTPGQAIVGFGILASLVLLLLGRRRGDADPARRDR